MNSRLVIEVGFSSYIGSCSVGPVWSFFAFSFLLATLGHGSAIAIIVTGGIQPQRRWRPSMSGQKRKREGIGIHGTTNGKINESTSAYPSQNVCTVQPIWPWQHSGPNPRHTAGTWTIET